MTAVRRKRTSESAPAALAHVNTEIEALARFVLAERRECGPDADWGNVGDAESVRALLLQAAVTHRLNETEREADVEARVLDEAMRAAGFGTPKAKVSR